MPDFIKKTDEYLIPFYSRTPLVVVRGKDHWIFDHTGKKYLDFTSGISVTSFGHANKKINAAVKKQMNRISHISNLYIIPPQAELAEKISGKAFPGKAFFCNSGAEANESALKMARIYGNKKKAGKNKVLSVKGSFHGRTIATITLTGQEKYRKGFEPLLQQIDFTGLNNVRELEEKMDGNTCAIFLEAVQGEGGIYPLTAEFVEKIKELSKKHDALVIFDEVQAGMGRTGKYFGYQNFDIEPDMITMAKALGNGFPIGAVLVRNKISGEMASGMHASTFGGNFLACAAGLAVMEELNQDLLNRIQELSRYFKEKLEELKADFPKIIKENRVFGLMIGVDINQDYAVKDILQKFLESGILTLRAGENVLRLMPPYTIRKAEIDYFCRKFYEILKGL